MKVDTQPFPSVNKVEHGHSARRQLDFSFDINMAGPAHHRGKEREDTGCHHGKEKEETGHCRGKKKEDVGPRGRPRTDGRQYITEEQVRNVRYQRPLSAHLLNKYERQYDQRQRYDINEEKI